MNQDNVEIGSEDLEAFGKKLQAWATGLSAKEQAILGILMGVVEEEKRRTTTTEFSADSLVARFQEQIRTAGPQGVVEYVVPKAGLAGKYCATVNLKKLK